MRIRLLLLLAALLLTSGCAGKRLQLFRGVDRSLYDVNAESDVELAPLALEEAPTAAPSAEEPWLEATMLTSEGVSGRAAWSTDGSTLVFQSVRAGGLVPNPWEQTWIMAADGATQRRVSMGIGKTHAPAWVPGDAPIVAFGSTHHTRQTPDREGPGLHAVADPDTDLYVMDLDKGAMSTLADAPGFDGEADFCRSGGIAAFVSHRSGVPTVYVLDLADPTAPRPLGSGEPARFPRMSADCTEVLWVATTEDGDMLVTQAVDAELPSPLLGPLPAIESADWIPGGVVFAASMTSGEQPLDLYRMGRDGDGLAQLTDTTETELYPRTSPDGTRLVFTQVNGEDAQVATALLRPGAPFTLPSTP